MKHFDTTEFREFVYGKAFKWSDGRKVPTSFICGNNETLFQKNKQGRRFLLGEFGHNYNSLDFNDGYQVLCHQQIHNPSVLQTLKERTLKKKYQGLLSKRHCTWTTKDVSKFKYLDLGYNETFRQIMSSDSPYAPYFIRRE